MEQHGSDPSDGPDRELGGGDVAVLGAGVIGAAVADRLAGEGLDVVLVESARSPGTGSSGRCDGNVLVQSKHADLLVDLTRRSIATYRQWQDELETDLHLRQDGSLVLLTGEDQVAPARDRIKHLAGLGVAAELLAPQAVAHLEPQLASAPFGAVHCAEDAEVYPPAVVAGLVTRALRRGVRLLTGTAASRLLVDPHGAVCGVATSGGVVRAPVVVNALGAWAPRLRVPPSAPRVAIEPRSGVLVATAARPGLVRHNLREAAYLTDRSAGAATGDPTDPLVSFAAEPTFRGNLLLGSSRAFRGFDTEVDRRIVAAILRRAVAFLPALAGVPVLRAFAGVRPWTPDGLPYVGAAARLPGYVLAAGHEGEGIGLAPATADLVADVIRGGAGEPSLAPDRATTACRPGDASPSGTPTGDVVEIVVDDVAVTVPRRSCLAAVIPVPVFCGMGSCQTCTVTVDDVGGVRACLTPVAAGMRVRT